MHTLHNLLLFSFEKVLRIFGVLSLTIFVSMLSNYYIRKYKIPFRESKLLLFKKNSKER